MKLEDIHIRDPFIICEKDEYYMVGSTDKDIWRDARGVGFDGYRSHDLVEWSGPYKVFRPDKAFWGKYNFWAPEVHRYNGSFYLFATFRGEREPRGTAILKAGNPLGPFQPWSDGKVTPPNWTSLDGTLYIDNSGDPWMVFCHEWIQVKDGTICGNPLTKDLKEACGEPVELFKSSDAKWSKIVHSPSNNVSGYVTDGCYLHRLKSGKLIMLWSCMGDQGYCIGYAVSEGGGLMGRWIQMDTPLLKMDGGHGMIFKDYNGRLLLSIHSPNKTPKERGVFIELVETECGLKVKENINDSKLRKYSESIRIC